MKQLATAFTLGLSLVMGFAGPAFALDYDTNITIYDRSGYLGSGTGGEDQETEPGMVNSQVWDLEAFYLEHNTLTMVGGFDFKNGVRGYSSFTSGDIFIDTDGHYGHSQAPAGFVPKTGNDTVASSFGYEYVMDLDFSHLTYEIYQLPSNAVTSTVYYPQNESGYPSSNPWRYISGGTHIGHGAIDYAAALSDAAVGGLRGGTHYAAGVDLSFLDPAQQFVAHFTMGCGNDNLMGSGVTPVPEPATMLLFGSGIFGLAMFQRRKSSSK